MMREKLRRDRISVFVDGGEKKEYETRKLVGQKKKL